MASDSLDFRVLFEGSPDVLLVLLPDAPKYTMVAATDARVQATHVTLPLGAGCSRYFLTTPTMPTPVILISARAGEDARLAGLETGADDYLVKPFAAREVITRIRTHLDMARVRRAAADAARELAETRARLLDQLEQKHAAT